MASLVTTGNVSHTFLAEPSAGGQRGRQREEKEECRRRRRRRSDRDAVRAIGLVAAINLDPNLNADNVVQTMRAANMYMIKDLMDECEH